MDLLWNHPLLPPSVLLWCVAEQMRSQQAERASSPRERSIPSRNSPARPAGFSQIISLGIPVSLQEKQKLLDEIEDLTVQLTEEQEKKRKMGDKLSQERHQFQKEKESTQEVSGAWACHRSCPQNVGIWPWQPLQKWGNGCDWSSGCCLGRGRVQQLSCSSSVTSAALKFIQHCPCEGAVPPWPFPPCLEGAVAETRGASRQEERGES